MAQEYRRGFTAAQKTELWDRWQRGESLKAIGRVFGKPSSSIYFQLAPPWRYSSVAASSFTTGIDAVGARGDIQGYCSASTGAGDSQAAGSLKRICVIGCDFLRRQVVKDDMANLMRHDREVR